MNPPRDHFSSAGLTAVSPETKPDVDRRALARLIAAHNEIMCPGYMIGMTDEILDGPSKSLAEAAEAGWISHEEHRMITGVATEEELLAIGFSPDKACEVMEQQRVRACASST
ncbi:MAG: hypothetical protein ABJE95_27480 [Byssovorax sp.]